MLSSELKPRTEHLTLQQYKQSHNLPNSVPSRPSHPESSPNYFLCKISPNPKQSFSKTPSNVSLTLPPSEHKEQVKRHGFPGNTKTFADKQFGFPPENSFFDVYHNKGESPLESKRDFTGLDYKRGGEVRGPGLEFGAKGVDFRATEQGKNVFGGPDRRRPDFNRPSLGVPDFQSPEFRGSDFRGPDSKTFLGFQPGSANETKNYDRRNPDPKWQNYQQPSSINSIKDPRGSHLQEPEWKTKDHQFSSQNDWRGPDYKGPEWKAFDLRGSDRRDQDWKSPEYRGTEWKTSELRGPDYKDFEKKNPLDYNLKSSDYRGPNHVNFDLRSSPIPKHMEYIELKDSQVTRGHSEKVKRSGVPQPPQTEILAPGFMKTDEQGKLEAFERENRILRQEKEKLEEEVNRSKILINENKRLTASIDQYRMSITHFTEMDAVNKRLQNENEELRHRIEESNHHIEELNHRIEELNRRIEELESQIAGGVDIEARIEARIEAKYAEKFQAEVRSKEQMRIELKKLHELEARIQDLYSEKVDLESEIEKIRGVKLALDSQLNKFRSGYEEMEQEIRAHVEAETELKIKQLQDEADEARKEVSIVGTRLRMDFDREILELNSIIRDLRQQLHSREEKVKRSTMHVERNNNDLKEKLAFVEKELQIERNLRIESERNQKSLRELNENLRKEVDVIGREYKERIERIPNKEKLLEEVVMELEKVNHALRIVKSERDDLRTRLGYLQ